MNELTDQADGDLEDLLRATFQTRRSLVCTRPERLANLVLIRRARRRTSRRVALAFTAGVLALVGLGIPVLHVLGGQMNDNTMASPLARAPAVYQSDGSSPWPGASPPEHRVSALGAEIRVPADWQVNPPGCGVAGTGIVLLALREPGACLGAEPGNQEQEGAYLAAAGTLLNRQLLSSGPAAGWLGMPGGPAAGRPIRIGGLQAERAEGSLPDGRYAGWVLVPSRNVLLSVRTLSPSLTTQILDSLVLLGDRGPCLTLRGMVRPC